jgi:hypothetical protein
VVVLSQVEFLDRQGTLSWTPVSLGARITSDLSADLKLSLAFPPEASLTGCSSPTQWESLWRDGAIRDLVVS